MTAFGLYSRYYDLLYRDKDYRGEARFVLEEAARHGAISGASIFELGCGTGMHAAYMADSGCSVHGIDRSSDMLAEAQRRRADLSPEMANRISFALGDVRAYRVPQVFEIVVSLFHVLSYQTSNGDVRAMLGTAAAHMRPGSLLAFDFWYGPAVLSERPETRVKRMESDAISVLRIAESTVISQENRVDVRFSVLLQDKATGKQEEIKELHSMRYFSLPEIDLLLELAGLVRVTACEWLTRAELNERTWGAFVVARKL
jgi:SAM-dependent methyltransferase